MATVIARTAPTGVRPGVKREDIWDWHDKPYFMKCEPHNEVSSIDPGFAMCKDCGHSWRSPQPRPQRGDFADFREWSLAIHTWSKASDAVCDSTVPNRLCVTCKTGAELPIHHLNVCHGCGVFICYDHTFWHGEEDGETLCRKCRMAMAKDGRLPKGMTLYGKESEAAMERRMNRLMGQ